MDQQRITIKRSLIFLDILGLHPYKEIKKLQVSLILLSFLTILTLIILQFVYEEITFSLISDAIEAAFTIIHVLSKFLTLLLAKSTLRKLLDTTNSFWLLGEAGVGSAFKVLIFLLKSFLAFIAVVIGIFAVRPIFNGTLAISCYSPEFIPRSIFIAFNNAVFAISAFSVGSFDMFVCVIVILTATQMRILNYYILNVNFDKLENRKCEAICEGKLIKCIIYHNFLNDFLREVNLIISPALLVYFILAPIVLCFELYFISKSFNFAEITKSCIYIAGIIIELFFFFCLPATYLMVQSEQMINVIYNTGWENSFSLKIRKILIIMMQRSQKEAILTAGKMYKVNLETCTNAFRLALSFYTCLKIIDDKAVSE